MTEQTDAEIEQLCERCERAYLLRDGHEPTPYCDECAHVVVGELRQQVAELECSIAARLERPGVETTISETIPDRWKLSLYLDTAEVAALLGREPDDDMTVKVTITPA